MIIETILTAIYNILDFLLFFEIPNLPEQVHSYVTEFFGYLELGAGVLGNYAPLEYMFILFGIILAVDAAILIYHFVMWILKKIPMLGIS